MPIPSLSTRSSVGWRHQSVSCPNGSDWPHRWCRDERRPHPVRLGGHRVRGDLPPRIGRRGFSGGGGGGRPLARNEPLPVPGGAAVSVPSSLASVSILVPRGWVVEIRGLPLLG